MAIRNIRRQSTVPGVATSTSAPIYVDSDDNKLKFIPAGSGSTEVEILDANNTSQTITGKTLSADIEADTKVLAATQTYTSSTVLTTLTGFSWTGLVAGKTYQFEAELYITCTTNGGIKVADKQSNSLTLTSILSASYAATAADNTTAVSTQVTSTADQASLVATVAAAYTRVALRGSFVVGVAGDFAFQTAQNTSSTDTTSILLGSFARVTRVN